MCCFGFVCKGRPSQPSDQSTIELVPVLRSIAMH